MLSLYTKYDEKKANTEIKKYLPTISKKGSGDDVSIAYAVNLSKLNEIKDLFEENEPVTETDNAEQNKESNTTECIGTPDELNSVINLPKNNDSQDELPFGFSDYSDW